MSGNGSVGPRRMARERLALEVFQKKNRKQEECSKRIILIAKCTLLQLSIKRRQEGIVDSLTE